MATTHHSALKAYAEVTEGASNASMEFDEVMLAPTYRLIPGIAGRSGGLEMAGRFGLPEEVLEVARSGLSESHRMVDDYLSRLHEIVDRHERELAKARAEREGAAAERREAAESAREAERELRMRYDSAVAEALARIGEAGAEVARQVRDRAAALQVRSEMRKATRKATEELTETIAPPKPTHITSEDLASSGGGGDAGEAITPGSTIRVRSLGAEGTVRSVNRKKRRAEVEVRGMRMTVKLGDCELVAAPAGAGGRRQPVLPKGVSLQASSRESAPVEINLIGRTVDEARGLLDKFLDDTVLAGHREVRIVHGHGTGRLRAAVAEILSEHPLVEDQRPADPRAGGTGATVAILKE
jgi:DNA mismatch repair protein MutS2